MRTAWATSGRRPSAVAPASAASTEQRLRELEKRNHQLVNRLSTLQRLWSVHSLGRQGQAALRTPSEAATQASMRSHSA